MARVNTELTDFYQRQLTASRKAYNAGVLPALYDAICACVEGDIPPPPWVMAAMLDTVERLFAGKFSDAAGRTGNPKARYRANLVHYVRWDAVVEVRERQAAYKLEQRQLKAMQLTPREREAIEANTRDPGRTWEDAYKLAAKLLIRTAAYGSSATIKNSYLLVQKAASNPPQHWRFYLAKHRTRRQLGISNT